MAVCDLTSQASFLYIVPLFLGYFSMADPIVVGANKPEWLKLKCKYKAIIIIMFSLVLKC